MKKALDVGCSLLVAVVAMAGAVAETPQETFGLRPKRIACIGDLRGSGTGEYVRVNMSLVVGCRTESGGNEGWF